MEFKPHVYQDHAIQHILDNPASGLFLEMGLGKTVSTLTALDLLLFDRFEISKALVIAPLRVADSTWGDEITKWDHLKHLRISKVLGSVKQRKDALKQQADIYLINRENVPWLVGALGKNWDFDTVVIDELSSFKSSGSQRFRALRKVRPLMKRVIGLTGTPAPNGLHDLYSQVYLLDMGERLGRTQTEFRERFMNASRNYASYNINTMKFEPKEDAADTIQKKIADICISMKAEDWLDVPERIDRPVMVKLSKKSREQYERLERDMLLPLAEVDIVANGAAVLTGKLLQLANGAVYDEDGTTQHLHDEKLEALQELVEAANGQPVLVFYSYKHDVERILKAVPGSKQIKNSADLADWNAGKITVGLAHPASAGHGLNMQDGGNQIIWFGLPWSLELYQQANARLHRQGQKQKVIVHHLIAEGTMDEEVMERIESKAEGQDALIEAVKARIERYSRG